MSPGCPSRAAQGDSAQVREGDLSDPPCGAEQRYSQLRIPYVPPAVTLTDNPLAGMPSVLAIRDLRRRLRRSLGNRPLAQDTLVQILMLDPLAVLRGLRAATAPVFGASAGPWTVTRLVQTLGAAQSRRLLDTPVVGVAGTTPIRRMWLHSIATACAARELAAKSGLLDPEAAYLLGLLHDLPTWLQLIARHQHGGPSVGAPAEWMAHWQLPAELSDLLLASSAINQPPNSPTAGLLLAAELLAELADFQHPNLTGDSGAALAAAEKDDLIAAQRLRREVETTLRDTALDFAMPDFDVECGSSASEDDSYLFGAKRLGNLDEVVLSLLSCTRATSYRAIVTAMLGASVRFGGYDRAFYVKWNRELGTMILRSKADSSARHLGVTQVRPNAAETAVLRRALEEERPARLDAPMGAARGLLQMLSIDEALVVPLNREFTTPAFLVLDRSLSLQPIQLVADAATATTLGMTGSLLNENLLLRRRRHRAHQFALTDPLTRLFNRRMGVQSLDQEIARASRTRQPLTVLMCDLDHFKHLNDAFGHLQGDQALRSTADVLRQTLRRSDMICRFGGEEFLVVLPNTAAEDATVLATRLFTAIETRGIELGLPLTISIGLTSRRSHDSVESLLHRADQALYASKGFGRNRFSADTEDAEPNAELSPESGRKSLLP